MSYNNDVIVMIHERIGGQGRVCIETLFPPEVLLMLQASANAVLLAYEKVQSFHSLLAKQEVHIYAATQ